MPTCPDCDGRMWTASIKKYNGVCYSCHKKKAVVRKAIPKTLKDQVWRTHFKQVDGKCFVCSRMIGFDNFVCAHIVAVANGGEDTLENLRPCCTNCNNSMGVQNLLEFKKKYFSKSTVPTVQSAKPPQSEPKPKPEPEPEHIAAPTFIYASDIQTDEMDTSILKSQLSTTQTFPFRQFSDPKLNGYILFEHVYEQYRSGGGCIELQQQMVHKMLIFTLTKRLLWTINSYWTLEKNKTCFYTGRNSGYNIQTQYPTKIDWSSEEYKPHVDFDFTDPDPYQQYIWKQRRAMMYEHNGAQRISEKKGEYADDHCFNLLFGKPEKHATLLEEQRNIVLQTIQTNDPDIQELCRLIITQEHCNFRSYFDALRDTETGKVWAEKDKRPNCNWVYCKPVEPINI